MHRFLYKLFIPIAFLLTQFSWAKTDDDWSEGWVATSTSGTSATKSGEKWDGRVLMLSFTYKFG